MLKRTHYRRIAQSLPHFFTVFHRTFLSPYLSVCYSSILPRKMCNKTTQVCYFITDDSPALNKPVRAVYMIALINSREWCAKPRADPN